MAGGQSLQLEQFNELFRTQYTSLFSLGYSICQQRELTKDVIQSVFLILWKKRDELDHVLDLPAYLRKTLVREMMRNLKANRRQQKHLRAQDLNFAVDSPETLLIHQQERLQRDQELSAAIEGLPEQQQQMLRLRFQKGLSYEEIAELTGKSKQTVYNQIYTAIKKLKQTLLLGLVLLFLA